MVKWGKFLAPNDKEISEFSCTVCVYCTMYILREYYVVLFVLFLKWQVFRRIRIYFHGAAATYFENLWCKECVLCCVDLSVYIHTTVGQGIGHVVG